MSRAEDRAMEQTSVLKALEQVWRNHPYLRLCQLICNAADRDDPFYVEDADLVGGLNRYRGMHDTTETT